MLTRYIFFLSLSFTILSCNSGSETKTNDLTTINTTLASELDTFYTAEGLMYVNDTNKTFFESLYRSAFDTSETKCISAFKDLVYRNGDTLLLKLNGQMKAYMNDSKIESDSYTEYHFISKFEKPNYYLLKVYYYEAFSYLLVNAITGKETYICGEPAISPDLTKIAASCFDLQAGFVYNGIQVFNVGADSLTPLWSRELTKWGADKIAWMNSTDLVAEQLSLDSGYNTITNYITIAPKK